MKRKKLQSVKKPQSSRMIALVLMLGILLVACKKNDVCPAREKSDPIDLNQNAANSSSSNGSATTNGKYVIEPASGKTLDDVVADAKTAGAKIVRVQKQLGYVVVKSSSNTFKTDFAKNKSVGTITTSYDVNWTPSVNPTAVNSSMKVPKSNVTNSNPLFGYQWSHLAINSDGAWQKGYKGNGAVVAVVDGGFFPNHPDIKDNVNTSLSTNFVDGESLEQAFDGFGHGTHCAGIIAALDNDIGTVGVAPEAELVLVKVLADAGYGSFEDVAAGIIYAADQGVDIISMSLGANLNRTSKDPDYGLTNEIRALINFVNKAVKYAESKGVTVIVAAGNDSEDPTQSGHLVSPVGAPGAIGISALGPRGWGTDNTVSLDNFASYSNWGTNTVDLSGSGGDFTQYPNSGWFLDMVLSPSGSNKYYFAAGTSMATPQVAGVAALIVGKNGSMSPAQLKTKLAKCVDDLGKTGRDQYYGQGRVNAYNAVK